MDGSDHRANAGSRYIIHADTRFRQGLDHPHMRPSAGRPAAKGKTDFSRQVYFIFWMEIHHLGSLRYLTKFKLPSHKIEVSGGPYAGKVTRPGNRRFGRCFRNMVHFLPCRHDHEVQTV